MANYQVAVGHNNAAGLADWDTPEQPRCPGLQAGRRLVAGDAVVRQDGKRRATLYFSYFKSAQVDALEDQLGLDSDAGLISGEYTVTLPKNKDRTFGNFNVTLTIPDAVADTQYDRGRWLPYSIEVTNISEIA